MNGRFLFSLAAPWLRLFTGFFSLCPQFARQLIWDFWSSYSGLIANGVRYALLSAAGASLGSNVYIGPGVIIKNPRKLTVGRNVSIHANCYIDAIGGICIGDDVSIAHSSSLISFDHTWTDLAIPIKYNAIEPGEINIARDVWIGCGVRVLAGASISSRSVVAAGAVLTGQAYEPGLIAGAPAHTRRPLMHL